MNTRRLSQRAAAQLSPPVRLRSLPRSAAGKADIRIATDLDECRRLWQAVVPPETITDLWEVRQCFHDAYRRPLVFIAVEDEQGVSGLLPLSLVVETGRLAYFPGETWQERTWLEQNRVFAGRAGLRRLLSRCPLPFELRYLVADAESADAGWEVDEIGYLFFPARYDYDIRNYHAEFSHKSIKQILREVAGFERQGVDFRYDEIADFELMVRMNIARFGRYSYFHDGRFREAFRNLARLLHRKGWLRMTTVLVGGQPAAVDMGCIYRGVYTVMAGGTDARFAGIAKLINLHHLERACRERLQQVDFLCGDFNWKKMFHLTPRPLYRLSNCLPAAGAHPPVPRALHPAHAC